MKGLSCYFLFFLLLLPGFASGLPGNASEDPIKDTIKKVYELKNNFDFGGAVTELNLAIAMADTVKRKRSDYFFNCYTLFIKLYLDFDRGDDLEVYEFLSESHLKPNSRAAKEIQLLVLKALISAKKGNQKQALSYINKAKSILIQKEDAVLDIILYYEAQVLLVQEEYARAIPILQRIFPLKDPNEENYINAGILLDLAHAHLRLQEPDRAMAYMEKVSKMPEYLVFPKLEIQRHLILSELFRIKKKPLETVKHRQLADSLKEKYFNIQSIEERNNIAYHNTSDFKDRVIDQYKIDAAKQSRQVNIAKIISIMSSVLLIIIFLLTISLYRNNKIKLKTNNLLLKKNRELQAAKEEAESALQVKARFLSTVSHELRTPLYAVTGLTHLLLEENPRKSQKEYLNSLKFSGEYLLNFINDILQVNKSEANQLKIKRGPFNMEQLLGKVAGSLEHSAKENNNIIKLDLDKDIPAELIGDSLKLSQVFINLIGNSLKFTENGEVVILGRILERRKSSVKIHFEVRDDGMGIEPDILPRIFDSFAQGSTQINRKYGGTGLGLTIVKNLLNLMDSDIRVESDPGKGSTFLFDLTLETGDEKGVEKPVTPTLQEELTEEEIVFEDVHVLLVEDNKINQVVTQKMLARKNITSEVANDGYEAIDKAKNKNFDLILMDIHMPGISGIKATTRIREFDKKVPIVALTAISLEENMDDLYNAGCNDIITKPFKPQTFYKKIKNNLGGSSR
ncbi:response regulator [Sinomicrobium weinanense]|uniref:histidine kinase n=1 Tax=Sinomicrobium weinanense TaxID=2842200 RepID=A0A926JRW2_9FLAO|nr:response regulator [Sinomicrobium weinanense]MBC9796101.1 response regulator [Sinomicrobium weinanense]MBU3124770.1 response regulator [Sinomicrobium weinanense]